MEVRYLMHAKQRLALDAIPRIAGDFAAAFGRDSGGLVRGYRLDDAETVVVALGSVLGTIEDVVDARRERGERVGALAIRCFRPYPLDEVRAALAGAERVVVVEKAFAVGVGGIVGQNVRLALQRLPRRRSTTSSPVSAADRSRARRSSRCSTTTLAGRLGRAHVPRPPPRRRRARARPPRARRDGACADDALPADQVLPGGLVRGRQPPARSGRSARSRPTPRARTR